MWDGIITPSHENMKKKKISCSAPHHQLRGETSHFASQWPTPSAYYFHKSIIFIAGGSKGRPLLVAMAQCGHLFARPPREVAGYCSWCLLACCDDNINIEFLRAATRGRRSRPRDARALSDVRWTSLYGRDIYLWGWLGFTWSRVIGGASEEIGVKGENEEKAAPGSSSSERFQFSALMGYVVFGCVTGQDRVGVETIERKCRVTTHLLVSFNMLVISTMAILWHLTCWQICFLTQRREIFNNWYRIKKNEAPSAAGERKLIRKIIQLACIPKQLRLLPKVCVETQEPQLSTEFNIWTLVEIIAWESQIIVQEKSRSRV